MFEPENDREIRREKPALLSLVRDGPDTPREPVSVLDRDAAGRHRDAARRHQRARQTREARRSNPLLAGLAAETAGDRSDSVSENRYAASGEEPPDDDARGHGAEADFFRPLIDPSLLAGRLWDWRYRIAGLTVAGFLIGSAFALSNPHRYTAYAQILIDPRELKLVGRDIAPDFLANEAALAIVDSQVELVYSPAVLGLVIERANLDRDPEFNGTSETLGGVGEAVRQFLSLFRSGNEAGERSRSTMRSLRESIWAERSDRTFIVNLGVTTRNPEKSALIANELTRAFISEQGALQSDSARDASSALGSRLDTLRRAVAEAEQELESYRAQNGLIGPEGRLVTDDQLAAVTAQLAQARADTIAAKSRAQAARSVDASSVVSNGLPQDLTSNTLGALRSQHGTLRQQFAALENTLGPRHPKLADARASLQSVESEIAAEVRRIVAGTQADLRRAVENEQGLAASLAQLKAESVGNNDAQIRLRELERELTAAREIYEAVLLRTRETGEIEALSTTNVKVIAPAEPPENPSSVSRKIVAAGFGAGGFMLGIVLAFLSALRESLSRGPDNRGPSRKAAPQLQPRLRDEKADGAPPPDRPGKSGPQPAAARLDRIAPRSTVSKEGNQPMYPYSPYHGPVAHPMMQQQAWGYPGAFPGPAMQGYAGMPPYPVPQPWAAAPVFAPPPGHAYQAAPPTYPAPQPQAAEAAPPARASSDAELDDLRHSVREIREAVQELMRRRSRGDRRSA